MTTLPVLKLRIIQFKAFLKQTLHQITARVLLRWVLHLKSQPFTVTANPIMVFSPHQDDETLGCGGLIAIKRSRGVSVQVVFLTDGRYGRPAWIAPEEIIQVRQQEARMALTLLGVAPPDIHFYDQVDNSLSNLPDAVRHHLIDQLVDLLHTYQPQEVYVPHQHDNHPDHEATFDLVRAAILRTKRPVDLFQYPIWLFWQDPRSLSLAPSDLTGAYRLAIAAEQSQKHRAIATYQSQIPGLPSSFLQQFFSTYEIFFLAPITNQD